MPETVLLYWHDAVMTHDTGEGVFDAPPSDLLVEQTPHPENALRIANMKRVLEQGPGGEAARLAIRHGLRAITEILRFHSPDIPCRTSRQPTRTAVSSPAPPAWRPAA